MQAPLPIAHELHVSDLAWSAEGDALLLLDKDRFCVCSLPPPAEPASSAALDPSSAAPPIVMPAAQMQPSAEEEAAALAELALEGDDEEAPRPSGGVSSVQMDD